MARLVLCLDNQVLAEYNLSKERYTIGRLPDNDVRIDNPTVSGHHSLIINILNDSFLEDLNSTNGTYVNGKLIRKHALQNGDVITVGRHQLRFISSTAETDDDDEFARTMVLPDNYSQQQARAQPAVAATGNGKPPPPAVAAAKIQVLNGSMAGRELLLSKPLTTMGQTGAQVIAITRRTDGYHLVQVENAEGREPPKINGQPIGVQVRKLRDNDVIELLGVKMGFFFD